MKAIRRFTVRTVLPEALDAVSALIADRRLAEDIRAALRRATVALDPHCAPWGTPD